MSSAVTQARAYDELCAYTLTHQDPAFIHQHVVDAFTAQTADATTKPIALTFALVGLYLHFERGFTGKSVQRAHQLLARRKRAWPAIALPLDRGETTVAAVVAWLPGHGRDQAIERWVHTVWESYRSNESVLSDWLRSYAQLLNHATQ